MAINWFPGHMVKTKREIQNNLKLVDAVIEIRDARIPKSSKNPDIDTLCAGKPRVILLNKSDLTDPKVTKAWKDSLTNDETIVLEVNALKGEGLNAIKPALLKLLKEKHDRLKAKGLAKITTRAMVVGIPNVGKSTFINKMAKNNIAKTGDRPGVTKNKQWIKTKLGIELMDTPGVLWPKFEDEIVGLNLAFTGAIKDEIMDTEELALKLVERLQETNPEELMTRYKLTELHENPLDNLDAIARKRGAIIAGNQIDYNRIAGIILDEFRGGKIGKISLEKPE
ncbi:ribosome biogenesis GTPase YlqF [Clostridium perfringens]|uniref:ribosome biogenesis GTPase YlqF n=1 Tax=Clostridium perfringens TaxID=1502 RepID=UPI002A252D79|nr:ribosome biogenesis GTPase YlqF [Clostridium perfringens]MDM0604932.1 ribosome biogenesis GTPase YlqF [Clostridium perfringens]